MNYDFVIDPYCTICGKVFNINIGQENLLRCASCISTPPKFTLLRSIIKLNDHSKKIVHYFKYYDQISIGQFCANLLVDRYHHEIPDVDFIVPVPMNFFKRLFRLYNPPSILASNIGRKMNKKVIHNLLIKYKIGKPQVGLKRAERSRNLINTIKYNKKYIIQDKTILLIDDVFTTGATVNLCSKILLKAGAKKIYVFTIAYA